MRKTVGVRLSEEEQHQIAQRAARAGISLGAFMRSAALGADVHTPAPALNIEAWQQLAGAASNLNQIARRLNQLHQLSADAGLAEAAHAAAEIRQELKQFRVALLGARLEDEA